MDYVNKNSFCVNGNRLNPLKENHFNFHLSRRDFQIIKGTVYSPAKIPCSHTVLQVSEIDCDTQKKRLLGYTLTDEAGNYLISMEAKPYKNYEITIFTPLISNKKEAAC